MHEAAQSCSSFVLWSVLGVLWVVLGKVSVESDSIWGRFGMYFWTFSVDFYWNWGVFGFDFGAGRVT